MHIGIVVVQHKSFAGYVLEGETHESFKVQNPYLECNKTIKELCNGYTERVSYSRKEYNKLTKLEIAAAISR